MNKHIYYPEGPANSVQPIALGGTGAKTVEKATENLGLLTYDSANKAGGPLLLNANGVIGDDSLPDGLLSSTSPLLHGVTHCFPNGLILFKVTNFDTFMTYSVSVTAGSVSMVGDEITYVAGPTAGPVILSVNGYTFPIDVQQPGIQKPVITYPASGSVDTVLSMTLLASSFTVYGATDSHFSSEWQIATDNAFTNVVLNKTDDQVNKTSLPSGRLDPTTTYFARTRYIGVNTGVSAWSDPTIFTTGTGILKGIEVSKLLSDQISTSDYFGTSVALSGSGDKLAIGSSHNAPGNHQNAGTVELFHKSSESYIHRAIMQAFGQATTMSLAIANGGFIRVMSDDPNNFDNNYTVNSDINIPEGAKTITLLGKGASGAPATAVEVNLALSGNGTVIVPVNVNAYQINAIGGDGTPASNLHWVQIGQSINYRNTAIPGGASGPTYQPTHVGEYVITYGESLGNSQYYLYEWRCEGVPATLGTDTLFQIAGEASAVVFSGGNGRTAVRSVKSFTKVLSGTVSIDYKIAAGKTAYLSYIVDSTAGITPTSLTLTGNSNFTAPEGVSSIVLTGKGGPGTAIWNPGQAYVAPTSYIQWAGVNGGWQNEGPGVTTNPGYPDYSTAVQPAIPATAGVEYLSSTIYQMFSLGVYYPVRQHLISQQNGSPGQPYIAPHYTYTTGPSTTATVNGTTYTFAGGYGGAAQETSQTANVPSAGVKTVTYSVASGGSLRADYGVAAASATVLNLTGTSSFVVPDGVDTIVVTAKGAAGTTVNNPGSPAGDIYGINGGPTAGVIISPSTDDVGLPAVGSSASSWSQFQDIVNGLTLNFPVSGINGDFFYATARCVSVTTTLATFSYSRDFNGVTHSGTFIFPVSHTTSPATGPSTSYTYGADTQIALNGTAWTTFPGGYGGAATELVKTLSIPLAGNKTINYSVASGGSMKVEYAKKTVTGASSTATVNGKVLTFAGGIGGLAPVSTQVLYLDEGGLFGDACAMSKDGIYLITGAKEYDTSGHDAQGAVFISKCSLDVWANMAFLKASDGLAGDNFGYSVDINSDGTLAIVGSPYSDGSVTDLGAAYVFQRSNDVWSQITKLTPATGAAQELFGTRVSVAGTAQVFAVSAIGNDTMGVDAGAVYVFTYTGGSYVPEKITANDGQAGDGFGKSIKLSEDGTMLFIGAPNKNNNAGVVYVFTKTGLGWTQLVKLTANDSTANQYFGSSLDSDELCNVLVVGAAGNDAIMGAVYAFSRVVSSWTQKIKITGSDANVSDRFGSAISLSAGGDVLAVGSYLSDTAAIDAGSVYIYK